MNAPTTEAPRRRLHPITETASILGVSRTAVYQLVKSGDLHLVKIGGRSLIAASELDEYVARLRKTAARPTTDAGS